LSQKLPKDCPYPSNSQTSYLPSFENAKIIGQAVLKDFFKLDSSLSLQGPEHSFPAGSQKLLPKIVLPPDEDILLFELENTENSVLGANEQLIHVRLSLAPKIYHYFLTFRLV